MSSSNSLIKCLILFGMLCGSQFAFGESSDSMTSLSPVPSEARAVRMGESSVLAPKQKEKGFVLYLGLTGQQLWVPVDVSTTLQSGGIGGDLFIGGKIDRVIFGLAFTVSHFSSITQFGSGDSTSQGTANNTAFLLSPTVQVAILRSKEKQVELFGSVKLSLGETVNDSSHTPPLTPDLQPSKDESNFHISYQIAPGLRYWVHPQLGLSFSTGLQVDHFIFHQNNPSGLRADVITSLGLFGSLGLVGVF